MDLSNFDRKRWILYFDVLGKIALDRPVPVGKVYEYIVREGRRLNLNMSFSELESLLREFRDRGIVQLVNQGGELHVVLTDVARYWLLTYSLAMSNL